MRTLTVSFLALAALAAGASVASAQTTYLEMHVGYNYVDDGDLTVPPDITAAYDPSPVFGGSFGYLEASGFRIEGEIT